MREPIRIKTTIDSFKNDRKFTLYVDMDGVLTDFEGDFEKISNGVPFDKHLSKNDLKTTWGLIDNEGVEWWSEMNWKTDGKKLWNHVLKYDPVILSSPSRHPDSSKGKSIWCKRELGINQDEYTRSPKNSRWDVDSKIILCSSKSMFAKRYPNSILIDDTPKKIKGWVEAGGIGILHKNTEDTIKQLTDIISKF